MFRFVSAKSGQAKPCSVLVLIAALMTLSNMASQLRIELKLRGGAFDGPTSRVSRKKVLLKHADCPTILCTACGCQASSSKMMTTRLRSSRVIVITALRHRSYRLTLSLQAPALVQISWMLEPCDQRSQPMALMHLSTNRQTCRLPACH